MCLAVPAKIITIKDSHACVDLGGVKKDVSIALVPNIKEGDFVLVHAGYAIEKYRQDEALETLKKIRELAGLQDEQILHAKEKRNA